jgi:hypothetical protein
MRGPQFAIDGENSEGSTHFFVSVDELQPWLQISFPNEMTISSVKITNR